MSINWNKDVRAFVVAMLRSRQYGGSDIAREAVRMADVIESERVTRDTQQSKHGAEADK